MVPVRTLKFLLLAFTVALAMEAGIIVGFRAKEVSVDIRYIPVPVRDTLAVWEIYGWPNCPIFYDC